MAALDLNRWRYGAIRGALPVATRILFCDWHSFLCSPLLQREKSFSCYWCAGRDPHGVLSPPKRRGREMAPSPGWRIGCAPASFLVQDGKVPSLGFQLCLTCTAQLCGSFAEGGIFCLRAFL